MRGLSGNRHQARWQVLGIEAPPPLGEMPALPERSSLFERERRIVLGARLMGVTGEVQRQEPSNT